VSHERSAMLRSPGGRNRAAQPGVFNFSVSFLQMDDPFEDLTAQQAIRLQELVDGLPERQRPSTFVVTLPGNRRVRIRVAEGDAQMMRHGPGPFSVQPIVEECRRAVVLKLLEQSRKALTQLYLADVPEGTRKLISVRWKPPEEIVAIGQETTVRDAVAQHFGAFFQEFFPNLAVTIMQTLEDPANAPSPNWARKAWSELPTRPVTSKTTIPRARASTIAALTSGSSTPLLAMVTS